MIQATENMQKKIIDLLEKGVQVNLSDKFRQGNIIQLPIGCDFIATGDIHGHQRNYERIVKFADLKNNPDRHLILHEIIHGGPEDEQGGCLSYKLLFEAVQLKIDYPDRVHMIMANHDTSYISNGQVMKNGKEMNRSMRQAIEREFSEHSEDIKKVITNLLVSQPLAVRSENRIWFSHSLPNDRYVDTFDTEIFNRPITIEDLQSPGNVYTLTWGRKHSQETLDKLAKALDVDCFILGHQRQADGYLKAGSNLIIIASDHNHGVIIPVDSNQKYNVDKLAEAVVPISSIS